MGSPCGPLSPDIALTAKPVHLEMRGLEQKILGLIANLAAVSLLEIVALDANIRCEAEKQGRAATIFTPAAAEAAIVFTTS